VGFRLDEISSRGYVDWVAALGRNWHWGFAFGLVCVVAGLLALIRPDFALLAIALLVGAQLVVAGLLWHHAGGEVGQSARSCP
jgi:uncharacterized membrane protein HdeD (DUF308 family)